MANDSSGRLKKQYPSGWEGTEFVPVKVVFLECCAAEPAAEQGAMAKGGRVRGLSLSIVQEERETDATGRADGDTRPLLHVHVPGTVVDWKSALIGLCSRGFFSLQQIAEDRSLVRKTLPHAAADLLQIVNDQDFHDIVHDLMMYARWQIVEEIILVVEAVVEHEPERVATLSAMLNSKKCWSRTPLVHWVSYSGDACSLLLLLHLDAQHRVQIDFRATDAIGATALSLALTKNRVAVVELLLLYELRSLLDVPSDQYTVSSFGREHGITQTLIDHVLNQVENPLTASLQMAPLFQQSNYDKEYEYCCSQACMILDACRTDVEVMSVLSHCKIGGVDCLQFMLDQQLRVVVAHRWVQKMWDDVFDPFHVQGYIHDPKYFSIMAVWINVVAVPIILTIFPPLLLRHFSPSRALLYRRHAKMYDANFNLSSCWDIAIGHWVGHNWWLSVFTVTVTTYIVVLYYHETGLHSTTAVVGEWFLFLYSLSSVIHELREAVEYGIIRYISSGWNQLDLVSGVSLTWYFGYVSIVGHTRSLSSSVLLGVGALATWLRLFNMFTLASRLGLLVIITQEMLAVDVTSFIVFSSIVILGFAVFIFALFAAPESGGCDANTVDDPSVCQVSDSFAGVTEKLVWSSFGYFEPSEFAAGGTTIGYLGRGAFMAFLLVVNTVMVNLLIAMMSDSYARIRVAAEQEFMFKKAELIHDICRAPLCSTFPWVFLDYFSIGVARVLRMCKLLSNAPEDPDGALSIGCLFFRGCIFPWIDQIDMYVHNHQSVSQRVYERIKQHREQSGAVEPLGDDNSTDVMHDKDLGVHIRPHMYRGLALYEQRRRQSIVIAAGPDHATSRPPDMTGHTMSASSPPPSAEPADADADTMDPAAESRVGLC